MTFRHFYFNMLFVLCYFYYYWNESSNAANISDAQPYLYRREKVNNNEALSNYIFFIL